MAKAKKPTSKVERTIKKAAPKAHRTFKLSSTAVRDGMRTFYEAYEYFNAGLFGGELPMDCRIIPVRKPHMLGHFSPDRYTSRNGEFDGMPHEIALNPDMFAVSDDRLILATLNHEMIHRQQHLLGTAGRRGYHNEDFAQRSLGIGLRPTHDGSATGKLVGFKMRHTILTDGPYDIAYQKLAASGFKLDWDGIAYATVAKRTNTKAKIGCQCEPRPQFAWGIEPKGWNCMNCGHPVRQVAA